MTREADDDFGRVLLAAAQRDRAPQAVRRALLERAQTKPVPLRAGRRIRLAAWQWLSAAALFAPRSQCGSREPKPAQRRPSRQSASRHDPMTTSPLRGRGRRERQMPGPCRHHRQGPGTNVPNPTPRPDHRARIPRPPQPLPCSCLRFRHRPRTPELLVAAEAARTSSLRSARR